MAGKTKPGVVSAGFVVVVCGVVIVAGETRDSDAAKDDGGDKEGLGWT